MRTLLTTMLILACGPPPATAEFRFTERLEARALPPERPLRLGMGIDPRSLDARDTCVTATTFSQALFLTGQSDSSVFEAGRGTEAQARRSVATLGDDGALVARGTAADLEDAFSAGAARIKVTTGIAEAERRVLLKYPCQRTFPSAREFIERCGAGFVEAERYSRVGVWFELDPSPAPAPVNFVSWGAPAPSGTSQEAFDQAFDVRQAWREPEVSDLTQDLPASIGSRRLARLAGYPANVVGWCIETPVVGADCLEQLVSGLGALRLPSVGLTATDFAWRAAEAAPPSSQPSTSGLETAKALRARRAHCLDVELPSAVSRCTEAFAAQRAVCAECALPTACDPRQFEADWERLGFP